MSAPFLSSDYVMKYELPEIIRAAADGKLRLFWVYVSYAAYDATELEPFQAAHDVSKPLYALERPEQDAILLERCARHQGGRPGCDRTVQGPGSKVSFHLALCGQLLKSRLALSTWVRKPTFRLVLAPGKIEQGDAWDPPCHPRFQNSTLVGRPPAPPE